MLSQFIKNRRTEKDSTTSRYVRKRGRNNLKELEFAVRFSSFRDSPSVYRGVLKGEKAKRIYMFPKGTLPSTNQNVSLH